jgi:hypothetical protein
VAEVEDAVVLVAVMASLALAAGPPDVGWEPPPAGPGAVFPTAVLEPALEAGLPTPEPVSVAVPAEVAPSPGELDASEHPNTNSASTPKHRRMGQG